MSKFLLITLAIVSFSVPAESFGQETVQRAQETVGATPRASDSGGTNGRVEIVAPTAAATATPTPIPTPTPTVTSTLQPTSAASPSPKPSKLTSSPAAMPPQNNTAQNAENNHGVLYTILAAFGLAVLVYGVFRLFKQNTKQKNDDRNEKENQKCDSIKELLDQKIKEMEESVKNWPKEKIEKMIKEYAVNKFLNEQEKALLKQAESAKEKYDKLKEAIEMLQGKYDLCKLKMTSSEKLVLAKAVPEDINTLIGIEKMVAGLKTYSPMLEKEEWLEQFGKNTTIYLIKKGSEILGEISYEKKNPDHAYIDGLVIKPTFQKQGIGREVMRRILEELRGFRRIDLVTHPENPAIKLYESLGFKIESRKENYYGDGEPRLVMVLNK